MATEDRDNWHDCSPEQCVVNLMESVENIDRLLVVYIGKDGTITYRSNFIDMSTKIGMIEIVKEMILRKNVHVVGGEESS